MLNNFIGNLIILITALCSLVGLYYAYKVGRTKIDIAKLEMQTKELEAKLKKDQISNVSKYIKEISTDISDGLIDDPKWIEKFMDNTGLSFSSSIYGDRIRHFYQEKKIIAKKVISDIDNELDREPSRKICLLIDSGSTTYPLFIEICEILKNEKTKKRWIDNIYIVTNNIPGVQYLMKYGKEHIENNYSEIPLKSIIIPGKPLSVYAAITGKEALIWLNGIDKFLESEWGLNKNDFSIYGFVTGNYMTAEYNITRHIVGFNPVARGDGHVEIKQKMVDISDKVFILAPLTKYSFANEKLLNYVNGFVIDRLDTVHARIRPDLVEYSIIKIMPEKCVFYTTTRKDTDEFGRFYTIFSEEMKGIYKPNQIKFIEDFDFKFWVPLPKGTDEQIILEIPHKSLREKYLKGENIWDRHFVNERIN